MTKRLFGFVLMPFRDEFRERYELGIKGAIQDAGMHCERVDEQIFHRERILERIYAQIDASDFVIADLTGQNPNVFYEVGYAHAKQKLCILLSAKASDIPFDLKHHRNIIYNGSTLRLKDQLKADLNWIEDSLADVRTHSIALNVEEAAAELIKQKHRGVADVTLKLALTNPSAKRSPSIEAIYLYWRKNDWETAERQWGWKQNGNECPCGGSDVEGYGWRSFIKPHVRRILPGAWAPFILKARDTIRWVRDETELKDSYRFKTTALLRVSTSEGNVDLPLPLDFVTDEDIPF